MVFMVFMVFIHTFIFTNLQVKGSFYGVECGFVILKLPFRLHL